MPELDTENRGSPGHPRAKALRIAIVALGLSLVLTGVVVGVFADDAGGAALGVAMATVSLAFAAFLMRDGELLPRAGPVTGDEQRTLLITAPLVLTLGFASVAADTLDDGSGLAVALIAVSFASSLGFLVLVLGVLTRS